MIEKIELPADYYLSNFKLLLSTVSQYHTRLLTNEESAWIESFYRLNSDAQKLWVRLLTRKGLLFRVNKLKYTEINHLQQAVSQLAINHFVTTEIATLVESNQIDTDALFSLYTKAELFTLFPLSVSTNLKKDSVIAEIQNHFSPDIIISQLTQDPILYVAQQNTLTTLLLLFFGNSHQDLSQFVLTDLGLHRFECYSIDNQTQLFQNREDLEQWLLLSELSDRYYLAHKNKDYHLICLLTEDLPKPYLWTPLEQKRQKLLNNLARDLERDKQYSLALTLYKQTQREPSRERQTRILMELDDYHAAEEMVQAIQATPYSDDELEVAHRIKKKLMKKLGKPYHAPEQFQPISHVLTLDNPQLERVEIVAANYYQQQGWQVFFLENTFLNSLFGLAMWDIIFAPIKGSFINPYQLGPLDMFQQQFYAQRQVDIEQRLKQIESGQYNDWEQIYQQKKGISNYWVTWPLFTTEVLELALKHIPSSTMVVLFRRLLQDLKHNRTGMPDLIMFNEKDYLWVEIKGPGDKLQNNQLRWLQFFSQHHIPAEVAYVQWQEST